MPWSHHYPIYMGSIPESIQTFDASIISFIGSSCDIRQSNWHVSRRPRLGQHVRCRCRNTKRCSVIRWHKGDWNVRHVCFGPHFAGNHSVLLYFDDHTVSLKMDDVIDLTQFHGTSYFECYWMIRNSLQWRHNGRDGVSNYQPRGSLFNRLSRHSSKKTPKLRVTGEFPAQRASNGKIFNLRT